MYLDLLTFTTHELWAYSIDIFIPRKCGHCGGGGKQIFNLTKRKQI